MAWTPPRTWQPGELVTAALLNEQLRDNLLALDMQRTMTARVYRASNQSIPQFTDTPISFTDARYDPQSLFSPSNPTRLTAIVAGVYLMTGHARFTVSSESRRLGIRLNGVTSLARQGRLNTPSGAVVDVSVATLYALNAGDYIELVAYTNQSGGSIIETQTNYSAELSIQLVGATS